MTYLEAWGGVVGCQAASWQGCGGGATLSTVTEAGPTVIELPAREIVNEEPSRHSSSSLSSQAEPRYLTYLCPPPAATVCGRLGITFPEYGV